MTPLERLTRYQAEHAELGECSTGHAEKANDLRLALDVVESARMFANYTSERRRAALRTALARLQEPT